LSNCPAVNPDGFEPTFALDVSLGLFPPSFRDLLARSLNRASHSETSVGRRPCSTRDASAGRPWTFPNCPPYFV